MSARRYITANDIHARVDWPRIHPALGIAETFLDGKHHSCPGCGGVDRFRSDNKFGRGDYICSKSDPIHGDGFDLVMHVHSCDFATARKMVLQAAGLSDDVSEIPVPAPRTIPDSKQHLPFADHAQALWNACSELSGIASEYLEARHCVIPPRDGDLRWHANLRHPSGYEGAALVGLVTDAITNAPISLHRTWINADGTKAPVDPPRMLLKGHRKAGGVIRLWSSEAVEYGVSIGEGLESCLAYAHAYTPVWCAIDAGNLAKFPVLAGIQSLTIIADYDAAGVRAAGECGRRWAEYAEVVTVTPRAAGADVADVVAA